MTTHPSPGPEPVLAAPPGLVLPASSAARLRRQFDARPPGVVAVVAPTIAVPAGSSVVTASEWASMAPLDACTEAGDLVVAGVALLAPGVDHVVDDTTVSIAPTAADPRGTVLIDPGAPAFDPSAHPPVPLPPVAEARPPFRWRPVVVFLAGAPDPDRARSAASLADALVEHGIEPRLAVHEVPGGARLTGTCLPDAATLAALRPDLVVALDPIAVGHAEQWSASERGTVVAVLEPALDHRVELVSWTIGSATGRLRARVGDHVDPAELAELVNRLCSGPLPGPPTDAPDPAAASATPVELGAPAERATRPAIRRVRIVTGPEGASPLLAGLADHLAHAGHQVIDSGTRSTPTVPAAPADLLLLDASADRPPVADRTVVVEVHDHHGPVDAAERGSAQVEADPDPGTPARLALAADGARADQLRLDGTRTLVVPVLRTRERVAALTAAAGRRVRPAAPTIGWLTGAEPGSAPPEATVRAVVAALDDLAATRADLQVTVVAPHPWLIDALGDRSWAARRRHLPDPDELAGWSAAVWTAPAAGPSPSAPPAVLGDVALVGVPVVLAVVDAAGSGAVVDRALTVGAPDLAGSWSDRLLALLDEDRRRTASARAVRIATALHGDDAAGSVVERLLGWCDAEVAP